MKQKNKKPVSKKSQDTSSGLKKLASMLLGAKKKKDAPKAIAKGAKAPVKAAKPQVQVAKKKAEKTPAKQAPAKHTKESHNVSATQSKKNAKQVAPVATTAKAGAAAAKGGAVKAVRAPRTRQPAGPVCREPGCEALAIAASYCRLHYIKNWKRVKRKVEILKEGKLTVFLEELVMKYPEKYIEAIRLDLSSDAEFAKVIHDLDLDGGVDDIEGVEGAESEDSDLGEIKTTIDDDVEAF